MQLRPLGGIEGGKQLRGRLVVGVLERSLTEVVRRHDVLRTTYPTEDGLPRQKVAKAESLRLPIVDLRGLPEALSEARRRLKHEATRPFDLARDLPLRAVLRAGLVTIATCSSPTCTTSRSTAGRGAFTIVSCRRFTERSYEGFRRPCRNRPCSTATTPAGNAVVCAASSSRRRSPTGENDSQELGRLDLPADQTALPTIGREIGSTTHFAFQKSWRPRFES